MANEKRYRQIVSSALRHTNIFARQTERQTDLQSSKQIDRHLQHWHCIKRIHMYETYCHHLGLRGIVVCLFVFVSQALLHYCLVLAMGIALPFWFVFFIILSVFVSCLKLQMHCVICINKSFRATGIFQVVFFLFEFYFSKICSRSGRIVLKKNKKKSTKQI